MSYTDWMIAKLIVLGLIVFFVSMIYTAITGKSIARVRTDTKAQKERSGRPGG